MPTAIIIIKIVSKCIMCSIWLIGVVGLLRSFKTIMGGAIKDFKINKSTENRIDIAAAYGIYALSTIAMIAILATIIMY